MQRLIISVLILCLTMGMASGQSDEYTRKSITFLDAIILASPSARDMTVRQIDQTAEVVKRMVQLDRFDYNPIPSSSSLMSGFLARINASGTLDLNEIADLLNSTFVADIIAVIDENAEQRASDLVDETARMSFVTTKAKDLGITAENLEMVFNSGYIYLPYINGFSEDTKAEEEDDEMKYTVTTTLSGGIFWFKIDYQNGQTSVHPLLKKETTSVGVAKRKNAKNAEWLAFENAAANYARNLENATKEIEEFKLKSQVMEVTGSRIGFNMGHREGLRIDDRFIIGEMVMNAYGELEFKEDGFARVSFIGNNHADPSALSYGYGVLVGEWAPGMSVIEYPTLNIDLYAMVGSLPLATSEYGYELNSAVAVGFEIAYNLGQFVNSSHWYLSAGAALGTVELVYPDGDNDFGGTAAVDVSFLKRYQFRRLDLFGKAGIAYHGISLENSVDELTYTHEAVGALLGGGLNVTMSIDLTVGLRYSMYTAVTDIRTVTDTDDDESEEYFNADFSGGAIMLQLIYAPKALGFDPFATIRSLADFE